MSLLSSSLNHGKSRTEQIVDMFARSIAGANRTGHNLRDVIVELKVQCQCESIRLAITYSQFYKRIKKSEKSIVF